MADINTLTGADRHIRFQACLSAMDRTDNAWTVNDRATLREAQSDDATHILAIDPDDDLLSRLADAAHDGAAVLVSTPDADHEEFWWRMVTIIPRDYPLTAAPLPANNVLLPRREAEETLGRGAYR